MGFFVLICVLIKISALPQESPHSTGVARGEVIFSRERTISGKYIRRESPAYQLLLSFIRNITLWNMANCRITPVNLRTIPKYQNVLRHMII